MKVLYKIFSILIFFTFQSKAQNLNLVGINPNYSQTRNIVGNFGSNLNIASVSSIVETVNNKEFPGGQLNFCSSNVINSKT